MERVPDRPACTAAPCLFATVIALSLSLSRATGHQHSHRVVLGPDAFWETGVGAVKAARKQVNTFSLSSNDAASQPCFHRRETPRGLLAFGNRIGQNIRRYIPPPPTEVCPRAAESRVDCPPPAFGVGGKQTRRRAQVYLINGGGGAAPLRVSVKRGEAAGGVSS